MTEVEVRGAQGSRPSGAMAAHGDGDSQAPQPTPLQLLCPYGPAVSLWPCCISVATHAAHSPKAALPAPQARPSAAASHWPFHSDPFSWPPASWWRRSERSTALGCNPSNLFLSAASCEKNSWGGVLVIQTECLLSLSSPALGTRTWAMNACRGRQALELLALAVVAVPRPLCAGPKAGESTVHLDVRQSGNSILFLLSVIFLPFVPFLFFFSFLSFFFFFGKKSFFWALMATVCSGSLHSAGRLLIEMCISEFRKCFLLSSSGRFWFASKCSLHVLARRS